jgi:hypothetical protein
VSVERLALPEVLDRVEKRFFARADQLYGEGRVEHEPL